MAVSQDAELLDKTTLEVPSHELVRWIREEIKEGHPHLNFYNSAWKEYVFDEDFDHEALGVGEQEDVHLVSVKAVLDIEPLIEQNYWFLQLIVTDQIGLRHTNEESSLVPGALSIDDFENEFLTPEGDNAKIVLFAETKAAREHFDEWFSILKSEHSQPELH